ncbi:hypothetical protein [Sphingopyxis sp. JAI128]|uniref:hypothetical protein n=1 Tax=Sphingopyxis sp. JAI128 TaxID=2723066 RepID=UPI001854EC3E|nr:hypothetical protein [Sphingopyxis sp. JAI128]
MDPHAIDGGIAVRLSGKLPVLFHDPLHDGGGHGGCNSLKALVGNFMAGRRNALVKADTLDEADLRERKNAGQFVEVRRPDQRICQVQCVLKIAVARSEARHHDLTFGTAGKLKQQRRIATRYDKTLLSFESFLNLAATRLWLKSFVNTT